MSLTQFKTIKDGSQITLVGRETLRRRLACKTLVFPHHLKAMSIALPVAPVSQDWTKAGTIQVPVDGNNVAGDCEEAGTAHAVGTMTGNVGVEVVYTTAQVLGVYSALTGYNPTTGANDNGTSTDAMLAYWQSPGMPGGHTILDDASINPLDPAAMHLAQYLFGPLLFTLSVPDAWVQNAEPGAVWDAGNGISADPNNGHLINFSGYGPTGYTADTWGFRVTVTPAGVSICDPEATAVFSLDWFNANGYAPNGMHYTALAPLWTQLTGGALPPSPYPAPSPGPGPAPVTPPPPTISPFQQAIDSDFAMLETAWARYPTVVAALQTAQPYVDNAIQEWPNIYGVAVGFQRAGQAFPAYAPFYRSMISVFVRLPT